ncbi:MAG: hypothetical protein Q9225_000817 [Loekoesia sp. 1 TL-2023]
MAESRSQETAVQSEPSESTISPLVESINKYHAIFSTAANESERVAALEALSRHAKALSKVATNAAHAVEELSTQPLATACIRIAIAAGIFDKMPPGRHTKLEVIAAETGAEPEFLLRILRCLVAMGVLEEVDEEVYAHTVISHVWTLPLMAQASKYWDMVNFTVSKFAAYFEEHGFQSPSDPQNSPIVFARGKRDMDSFTLMAQDPPLLDTFNDTMTVASTMAAKEMCATFSFDTLKRGKDDVVLVDVGGGMGGTLKEILATFPAIEGRIILQDLGKVLGVDMVPPHQRIEIQRHNFLTEVQPTQGAGAYLLKWVLHDWPDDYCLTIFKNLAPALRGYDSRLLICDMVLPDRQPSALKTLRDINMMMFCGKERSRKQWESLLAQGGFEIVKIHGFDNPSNSIIEAVLTN